MTPTSLQTEEQRVFIGLLAEVPHLVLSLSHAGSCSCNVHGRLVAFSKRWEADPRHGFATMDEDMLAFAPEPRSSGLHPRLDGAALPAAASGEPLVHLHVDWRQVRRLIIRTPAPFNRLGCQARIMLGPTEDERDAAFAFLALGEDIAPLQAYAANRWHPLVP